MTYGSEASLDTPFSGGSLGSNENVGLMVFPGSGLSQIRENEPLLADARPVITTGITAVSGPLLSSSNTASSFIPSDAPQAVRDGILGEEIIQLRKQVGSHMTVLR